MKKTTIPADWSVSASAGATRKAPGPAHPAAVAVIVAAIVAFATFIVRNEQQPTKPAEATPAAAPVAVASVDPVVERAVFFDAEVEPRIVETDEQNRKAATRCLVRLHQRFRDYRDGVQPFADDLTSISTRLGIARRMPGDWWTDDGRIEVYIEEKFENHLFSQQQLCDDIGRILEQFRDEVNRNQQSMLVDVRASLETADLPEVNVEQYDAFFELVAQRMRGYSAEQGTTSVYNALTVLVISEAGSYAAVSLVASLLARLGSSAAVTAAAGVGVTAGATATGAGGGSLAGPAGTVVGLGVGLVVGLVIDWWMTDQFQSRLTEQLNGYLSALENALLYGASETAVEADASSGSSAEGASLSGQASGLADALPQLCGDLVTAYRQGFYEQIVTGASP